MCPREGAEDLALSDQAETLLLVRDKGAVMHRVIGAAETAFLRACRDDLSSAEAAGRAFEADPDVQLAQRFAALIAQGVFMETAR